MKKIVCLILLLLVLSGCGQKKTVDTNMSGLSFDAAITSGDASFAIKAWTDGADFSAVVEEPKALAGMKIKYSGGEMTAEFLGLSHTVNNLPTESISDVLETAVRSVSEGVSAKKQGDDFVYTGNIGNSEYELFVDENGLPLSLSYPDGDIEVEFTNVKIR